jgi:dihydropteroate synthase
VASVFFAGCARRCKFLYWLIIPSDEMIPVATINALRLGGKVYDLSARTHIMGILNVTPDSFSDGGHYPGVGAALDRALAMVDEGADIIDVGGESSRPRGNAYGAGAQPVSADEELRRVIPVISAIAARTDIPISIDTYKSGVAREALRAGASLVNDITAFHADPAMPRVIGEAGATVALMHMKGTPGTMQLNPSYDHLFDEVIGYLRDAIHVAEQHGIAQVLIDPGIGFGKTLAHNLELLGGLEQLQVLERPVLIGASRKSFIGTLLDLPVDDRREGSLAALVAAILRGAHVVRVHDVKESKRAAVIADAIRHAGP